MHHHLCLSSRPFTTTYLSHTHLPFSCALSLPHHTPAFLARTRTGFLPCMLCAPLPHRTSGCLSLSTSLFWFLHFYTHTCPSFCPCLYLFSAPSLFLHTPCYSSIFVFLYYCPSHTTHILPPSIFSAHISSFLPFYLIFPLSLPFSFSTLPVSLSIYRVQVEIQNF